MKSNVWAFGTRICGIYTRLYTMSIWDHMANLEFTGNDYLDISVYWTFLYSPKTDVLASVVNWQLSERVRMYA